MRIGVFESSFQASSEILPQIASMRADVDRLFYIGRIAIPVRSSFERAGFSDLVQKVLRQERTSAWKRANDQIKACRDLGIELVCGSLGGLDAREDIAEYLASSVPGVTLPE